LISPETSLDIEWAQAIIYPQNVSVYQVAGTSRPNTIALRRFLDAIDGSFCVPSEHKSSKVEGKLQCGAYKPDSVISISYGTYESSFSEYWAERSCMEFLKLGLQGISILIGSGDNGVNVIPGSVKGVKYPECSNDGKIGGAFSPTFPGSCPYVNLRLTIYDLY
jgi:tripeptidyl-peptidase I